MPVMGSPAVSCSSRISMASITSGVFFPPVCVRRRTVAPGRSLHPDPATAGGRGRWCADRGQEMPLARCRISWPRSAHHRPRPPAVAGSGCRDRPGATVRRRTQTGGKKTPEVIDAIEILLEHDTAGDPITGIRWTHKTPAGIAELLRQLDIEISANTVARLLHDMDFSLRVNRKAIATDSSPVRDQQFRYISSLRTRFERQGLPIISV